MKYTKGEWKYFENEQCDYTISNLNESEFIAIVKANDWHVPRYETIKANAKLIAAAPEMP